MLLRFACDCCASAFVCVCVPVCVCACTCVLHSFMCYCCCCCWFSCRFMAPVVEHQTKRPPLKSMLHFSHLSPLHRVYAAYSACQLCGSGKRIVFACLQLIACDSLLNFRFVEFLNVFNFEKVFFFFGNEFSLRLSITKVVLPIRFSLFIFLSSTCTTLLQLPSCSKVFIQLIHIHINCSFTLAFLHFTRILLVQFWLAVQ